MLLQSNKALSEGKTAACRSKSRRRKIVTQDYQPAIVTVVQLPHIDGDATIQMYHSFHLATFPASKLVTNQFAAKGTKWHVQEPGPVPPTLDLCSSVPKTLALGGSWLAAKSTAFRGDEMTQQGTCARLGQQHQWIQQGGVGLSSQSPHNSCTMTGHG